MIEIGIMTEGAFPEEPRKGGSGGLGSEQLQKPKPIVKVDLYYESEIKENVKIKVKEDN